VRLILIGLDPSYRDKVRNFLSEAVATAFSKESL